MSLNILKQRLQSALNDDNEFEGFVSALSDAIYATNLSVVALEGWMNPWIAAHVEGYTFEDDYQKGVQFVADIWNELNSSN